MKMFCTLGICMLKLIIYFVYSDLIVSVKKKMGERIGNKK